MPVVASSLSPPAADTPGTMVPVSTPRRLCLDSIGMIKFLSLGLMGNTQASSDPLREGWWFCRERPTSFTRAGLLSIPAGEN